MGAFSRIPQLIVYGIISGSIISLGGIGVSLTYSILGFSNFAHGDIMALGAYICLGVFALFTGLGLGNTPIGPLSFGFSFALSFVLALALTALAVIVIDRILFKRLRKAGSIILMMASIGLALGLRNILQFFWGPQPHYYIEKIQVASIIPGLGIRIKPDQVFIIILAVALVVLVHCFLQYTKMGKAMRASADNHYTGAGMANASVGLRGGDPGRPRQPIRSHSRRDDHRSIRGGFDRLHLYRL